VVGSETQEEFVVENIWDQFIALKHHGEALGWRNPEDQGAPDPSSRDHYQGLVRYPGEGVPIFYVTQSDNDDDILPGASDKGGYLHVVRFGTRSTTGERLRSNLQKIGKDTSKTEPDAADTWLDKMIRFDGSFKIDGSYLPAYEHPGNMAIIDDILFVPLDSPRKDSSPVGQIVLFDISDRENLTAIQAIELNHKIDNLGVFKSENDDYIIWVNGDGGKVTKFYKTSHKNLRDNDLTLIKIQDWDPYSDDDHYFNDPFFPGYIFWPTGVDAYQSSAFIRQTNGSLYLIAMWHPGGTAYWREDYAELYRVVNKNDGGFKLIYLTRKHFYCVYDGGDGSDMRIGNFAAAGNAYVSPSGELILYSIPHDDEDDFDPDFTKLGEFRHRDVNRENSPLRLPTADTGGPYTVCEGGTVTLNGFGELSKDRPWVELYDDTYWKDRSIVVDYDDRSKLELNNFNDLDNFNDKTSSVRWRSPKGLDIILYDDDNYKDRKIILCGTGKTESISHLYEQKVVPGLVEHPGKNAGEKLKFNDKTSSMRFDGTLSSSITSINWDLDGDGLFGETGSSALYGDENDSISIFDASNLDGPTSINVTLNVTDSYGMTGYAKITVTVNNVAPFVSIDAIDRPNPHFIFPIIHTLEFKGSFTDPGWLDTHTTLWEFGDGNSSTGITVEENQKPNATGNSTVSYTYMFPGIYTVTFTVRDDDGGLSKDTVVVEVVGVEDPMEDLKEYIQNLPDDAFIKNAAQKKKTLGNKCSALINKLKYGHYEGVIEKLHNDLRAKADGCLGGKPKNDWVTDCEAQHSICEMIDNIIAYLQDITMVD
jgi:hypothetical protein